MKVYILHKAYGLCDYNEHIAYASCIEASCELIQEKYRIIDDERIEEVYRDEEDLFYVQTDETAIRLYITEHEFEIREDLLGTRIKIKEPCN